ncbi:hypothetical protein DGI_1835 [Megalodesulfovibrio gigas DSM 1382 = ATCC 19364]|uniref:AlgX/AlgJ SGNH hydrolase-like domain-containing protein n=1 Tax=Megalodesulfovibrio gigas (strain ATCC 19364 / DSM 1382 / NCIMB 9332 / VKM B-1759) TaxID=1121448 RepID=T2GBT9_MEGG1|nr:hypothetical protein DGI_1835 [Megalodesulfovibrio gigas DSM 1382 = ATCC 19364]
MVFVLLLAAPVLALLPALRPAPLDLQENRPLAPWPDLAAMPLAEASRAVELYVADHFPFRTHLVAAYIMVMERWLGVPVDAHLLGKHGELFFVMSDENTVRDYMGMRPLAQDELLRRRAYLTGLQAWCEGQGVAYLFMLGPNKTTIHPEWLPDWIQDQQGQTRQEQFLAMMAGTPVPVLDVSSEFVERKDQGRLFNVLSDTAHWNGRGLRLANELLVGAVRRRLPGLPDVDTSARMHLRDERAVTVYDEDVVPLLVFSDALSLRYDHTPAFLATVAAMPSIWLKPYRIVNDALPQKQGSAVLFATDSYFSTHVGQGGMPGTDKDTPWFPTPLPYLFHTFVHFHHDAMTRPALERFFRDEQPALLVHAYAERSMLWPWHLMDPELMALGEAVLGSPLLELTRAGTAEGKPVVDEPWDIREPTVISLPEAVADAHGRVLVTGRVQRIAGGGSIRLAIRGGAEEMAVTFDNEDEVFCVAVPGTPGTPVRLTAALAPQSEGRWLLLEPELLRQFRQNGTAGGR